jgi:hypothetical protein
VIDFMVMEAVYMRVLKEDADAQEQAEKEAKMKQWKSDTSELKKFQ